MSEGEGIHHIAQNQYPCKAGDIFVLNFDVPHRFLPHDNKPMVVYNCIFQPRFIDYALVNSRCFSDVTHHFLLRALVTEDQIIEIAMDVGYHDLKHFHAIFKRITGLSPSQYRS